MKKLLTITLMLLCAVQVFAQKEKKVSGSYNFPVPETMSVKQAEAYAVNQAKLNILADEFGTIVTSSTITKMSNVDGVSSTRANYYGESEVKGEWLETIGEPKISKDFKDEQLWIHVEISGRIREIMSSQIDLDIRLLSNGADLKSECLDFKNKQSFSLYFKSPTDGYLAIYLSDGTTAFRLLPYKASGDGAEKVKGGEESVFFNSNGEQEMQFTTDLPLEVDRLYVIFSPNEFTKALDDTDIMSNTSAPYLSQDLFQKWLGKCRREDPKMTLRAFDVTVTKD